MAHSHKEQAKQSHADKLRLMGASVPHPTDPWSRAERISGTGPQDKMQKPPNEAVPQFENDRSERDVPYGSITKGTEDD